MPAVIYSVDTITHITQSVKTRNVGTASPYYGDSGKPHPGTAQNIEGWKWDQRTWPSEPEFLSTAFIPTQWEPDTSNLPTAFWQSGIGSNNDLLQLGVENYFPSGLPTTWAPVINHGWYYIFDQEWYLHSDQVQTEYFTTANITASGYQYQDLKYQPRDSIPVLVRQFTFDRPTGKYKVNIDFRKKLTFTTSGTEEFMVDNSYDPPRVVLNGTYNAIVASGITVVSGVANPDEVALLELIGVSTGDPFQEFHSFYNPIEPTASIQVLSYSTASAPTEWTVISGINDFTTSGQQVYVDRTFGTFLFGNYDATAMTGDGVIPDAGNRIAIAYTKTVEVAYEPQDIALNSILALEGDVNPLTTSKSTGFVQITTDLADEAADITLIADLPFTPPGTYSIDMSNNAGEIIATVRTKDGESVEGKLVTFEINDPQVGDFGGAATTVTAITDGTGRAHVFYRAPLTVDETGSVTSTVTISGGQTTMDLLGLDASTSLSGIYTYEVHKTDDILGMSEASGISYYTEFFTDESILGTTAAGDWEADHRDIHSLSKPVTYTADDLRTGAKTILLTTRTIINPHTGVVASDLAPLHPLSALDIGTAEAPEVRLTFDSILPDPAGVNNTKSYLVIGESKTPIQASIVNARTGQRIYSNIAQLAITIPAAMNGTFFAEELTDIPSGLMLTAKNVELVSDAWINTTSGTYWDEYQRDKLLPTPNNFPSSITVRIRHGYTGTPPSGDQEIEITLLDGINELGSDTFISAAGTPNTDEFSIDMTDISISNWADLRVQLLATGGAGSANVTWIEVELISSSLFLRPISDIVVGDYFDGGAGALWDDVDEVIPDDAVSFISTSTDGGTCTLGITDASSVIPIFETYLDWFRRTQRGATTVLGLDTITASGVPGDIPLGFRLKSQGITVASILDAVTYIDPNDTLPSGFFTPSGWYNILT